MLKLKKLRWKAKDYHLNENDEEDIGDHTYGKINEN